MLMTVEIKSGFLDDTVDAAVNKWLKKHINQYQVLDIKFATGVKSGTIYSRALILYDDGK